MEEAKDTRNEKVKNVSVNLETELMRHFPEAKSYQNKARSLIFNLKDKSNVWLKESLLNGSLDPKRAVKLEAKELASEAKKNQRAKTMEHDLQARRTDWAQEQAKNSNKEGFFTCHKCGSKKTNFY